MRAAAEKGFCWMVLLSCLASNPSIRGPKKASVIPQGYFVRSFKGCYISLTTSDEVLHTLHSKKDDTNRAGPILSLQISTIAIPSKLLLAPVLNLYLSRAHVS